METIHANRPIADSTTKNTYRDGIELLRSRVSLLTGKDRLLMTMYLENGNTFRQLARLAGVNESNIARRIHRITKRLLDGEYITCLRNHDEFTRTEMAIAKDCFLLGLSQRKIAFKRNYSTHQVCKILKRIQQIVKTMDGA
jgi:DNA-directed RNA polymerase specialized sigma subunit